jgi:hypothetical protein
LAVAASVYIVSENASALTILAQAAFVYPAARFAAAG